MPTLSTPMSLRYFTNQKIETGEIDYYVRRLQNRMFDVIITAFRDEIMNGRTSRAILARRIGKNPAQITRWLSGPSNLRLDTISTILIGIDAELDPVVSFIRDKTQINYSTELTQLFDTAERNVSQIREDQASIDFTSSQKRNVAKITNDIP